MAATRDGDIRRLHAEIDDLQTADETLAKQAADLKREKDVYEILSETSHTPTPNVGGSDSTPSLTAMLKARELGRELDHVQGEQADNAGKLADARKELDETNRAAAEERAEQEVEQTKMDVETVVELSTEEHGPLNMIPTGGTARNVAETVAYVRDVTMPYVQNVTIPQLQAAADDLARPYEVSDESMRMHEETLHERSLQQLSGMKEIAAQMREMDLTDKDRSQAIDDAKASFKKQDEALAKTQEETRVKDETLREQQDVARAEMKAETNGKRHEVVQELLAPIAERNVQEQHAQLLSQNAANNQQYLDLYGGTLENGPAAVKAMEEYKDWLAQGQKDFQNSLDTQRDQDVQREVGVLQHQHFPEVTPPAMSGPGLAQPAGPGIAQSAAPAAPQQQGPSGPAM